MSALRKVLSPALAAVLLLALAPAALAAPVDPSTLVPPPPPGAKCHTAGNQVICDTVLVESFMNEPFEMLPCGQSYYTGIDLRDGFRFYEDGLMVRRHVTSRVDGRITLSPTGEGPYVTVTGHRNWWSVWPVPGGTDAEALVTSVGLDIRFSGPGIGSGFQIAGRFAPDGDFTGLFSAFTDESFDLLCDVLTAD